MSHLSVLDEGDEGGPLDLDGGAVLVEQLDHEVEEVGLSEVAGRLLRELDAGDHVAKREDFFYYRSI